ncbi:hypothetical protein N0V95_007954 [Ascochyta clinopodiicola]|nr:hypothetical protein N0V95_007954 [Ascochyta clinopodiicola]
MAIRVGQTRDGPRLLKTVGGKPHATNQDHDEAQHKQDTPQEGLRPTDWDELDLNRDLNRDPQSSGDERLRTPPKPSKSTTDSNALRQPSTSTRKRKAEPRLPKPEAEPGLRNPPQTKPRSAAAPSAALRVPKTGQFEQGRAAKNVLEGDKENTTSSPQDVWNFGMSSQPEQKKPKVTFGRASKTNNIHTVPLPARKRSNKPTEYGSASNKKALPPESEGSESEVSMKDDNLQDPGMNAHMEDAKPEEPEDPELRIVAPRKKKRAPHTDGDTANSSAMDKAELDDLLKPTLRDHLGLALDTPDSSLPNSSAPQQEMDHIDSYMRELPAQAEEGTECAICNEPVTQDEYWDFWKGRKKTVKNQAAFCHGHKKATAQREYDDEGLPPIQWDELPQRIKKHRMSLHGILTGDIASTYRARYEPLALTGKAAAVPSKRTDLSPTKQAQLASYALDDSAVYPGYYGPRGRRLITESVMALLRCEIKRCSDPVVQTSGPATFVQAVLVPEVAIRLIMEDYSCDWDAAEELRERTFDMGVLLNEEIEDWVEVAEALGDGSEEEEGNDYLL